MPSSPHLYARDRAWSWGKSREQQGEHGGVVGRTGSKLTAPRIAVLAIILSHCIGLVSAWHPSTRWEQQLTSRPLPLGDIGTPFLPVLCAGAVLLEPALLVGEVFVIVEDNHVGLARDEICSGNGRRPVWKMGKAQESCLE